MSRYYNADVKVESNNVDIDIKIEPFCRKGAIDELYYLLHHDSVIYIQENIGSMKYEIKYESCTDRRIMINSLGGHIITITGKCDELFSSGKYVCSIEERLP